MIPMAAGSLFCDLNSIAVRVEEGALVVSVTRLPRPVNYSKTILTKPFRHAINSTS
jgi:hypothetical protein